MGKHSYIFAAALLAAATLGSAAEARSVYKCNILERFIDRAYDKFDEDDFRYRARRQRALLMVIYSKYTRFCEPGGENPSPNRPEDFAGWRGDDDDDDSRGRRDYASWRSSWMSDRRR